MVVTGRRSRSRVVVSASRVGSFGIFGGTRFVRRGRSNATQDLVDRGDLSLDDADVLLGRLATDLASPVASRVGPAQ
jgi:hypothetical protein